MTGSAPAPLFVAIVGGTGSGKTTVAERIRDRLPRGSVAILSHDAYYRPHPELSADERNQLNFDHPDALDNALLIEHLDELRAGRSIQVPVYDFATHLRRPEENVVRRTPIVIVEGILTLVDPRLRERLDIKIYVETDPDIRVFRRIRRDMELRGRTFEQVRQQYYDTVRPMHLQFVEPSKRWADLIIPEGGENHVAVDLILSKLRSVLPAVVN